MADLTRSQLSISMEPATDATALAERIAAHDRFGSADINRWILEIARPLAGERVLDLGCGTGKQLLPVADLVGPSGLVVGLDASAAALAVLRTAVEKRRLDQVRLVESRMEGLAAALAREPAFDLVLCCFALYYSSDPEATLGTLRARLSAQGRVFVCGPAPDNNAELLGLVQGAAPQAPLDEKFERSLRFMRQAEHEIFPRLFPQVSTFGFTNPLVFPTVDALLAYWRSYRLYRAGAEAALRAAAEAHFRHVGHFTTHKVVRGALLR